MASKSGIIEGIRQVQAEAERVASEMPEGAWDKGVYENGWNAKQILCHVALSANVPAFLIAAANAPEPAKMPGGGGDIDDFNESQVAMRMEKPVSEILEELNRTYEQAINVVHATPDELFAKQIRTPWQTEGELGALILDEDIRDHVLVHLADISGASA
ncbi:MAG TPA: maleylpyruvate isomerase N-terminal domain-containing protein [Dehalococcoidia bacterium]